MIYSVSLFHSPSIPQLKVFSLSLMAWTSHFSGWNQQIADNDFFCHSTYWLINHCSSKWYLLLPSQTPSAHLACPVAPGCIYEKAGDQCSGYCQSSHPVRLRRTLLDYPHPPTPLRWLDGWPESSLAWICARSRTAPLHPCHHEGGAGWRGVWWAAAVSWKICRTRPSSQSAAVSPPDTGRNVLSGGPCSGSPPGKSPHSQDVYWPAERDSKATTFRQILRGKKLYNNNFFGAMSQTVSLNST